MSSGDDDDAPPPPPPPPQAQQQRDIEGLATLDAYDLERKKELRKRHRNDCDMGDSDEDDDDEEEKRVLKKFVSVATTEEPWDKTNVVDMRALEKLVHGFPGAQLEERAWEYISRSAEELLVDAVDDALVFAAQRAKVSGGAVRVTKQDVERALATSRGLARVVETADD